MSADPDLVIRSGTLVDGYDADIVAGRVVYRNGEATNALPGRLVRGARA
jgi:N-acyl-D-aspartate/D-glutamate deacylase